MSRKKAIDTVDDLSPADVPPAARTNIHEIYKCLRSWHVCEGKEMRVVHETPTHVTLQCMGCRAVQRHERKRHRGQAD